MDIKECTVDYIPANDDTDLHWQNVMSDGRTDAKYLTGAFGEAECAPVISLRSKLSNPMKILNGSKCSRFEEFWALLKSFESWKILSQALLALGFWGLEVLKILRIFKLSNPINFMNGSKWAQAKRDDLGGLMPISFYACFWRIEPVYGNCRCMLDTSATFKALLL